MAYGRAGVNGPFAAEFLCRLLVFAASRGPDLAGGTECLEAFGTFLAAGVQRLVALRVAEENVGHLGGGHDEVDILRL